MIKRLAAKISRRQSVAMQWVGIVLIVTVKLTDAFLFEINQGYILFVALISIILLVLGMRVMNYHDKEF